MIYLTGDTHSAVKRFSAKNWPIGRTLTKQDYVIILGDFGLLWDGSSFEEYWLNWLDEKPWTTLWLDGNHENFDMIDALPDCEMFGSVVAKVNDSVFRLHRGHVYNIDGNSIFTLGGGLSIDKIYRKEGKSWWPGEAISLTDIQNSWDNLADAGFEVDYMLTHTCPTDVLACYGINTVKYDEFYRAKLVDPASFILQDLAMATQYKHWYHGHLHENMTKMGQFTCLYETIIELGEAP
jgi:hypothetical protein